MLGFAAVQAEQLPATLTLAEAETWALEHNRELEARKYFVEQKKHQLGIYKGDYYPKIMMWGGYRYNETPYPTSGAAALIDYKMKSFAAKEMNPLLDMLNKPHVKVPAKPHMSHNAYTNSIQVTQLLLTGDVYHGLKVKDLEWAKSKADFENLRRKVLFKVRDAYSKIALAQNKVNVEKEHVKLLQSGLHEEEQRFQAGQSTALKVNQAKVMVAEAMRNYYEAVKQLQSSKNDFTLLLGAEDKNSSENFTVTSADLTQAIQQAEFLRTKIATLPSNWSLSTIDLDKLNGNQLPQQIFDTEEKYNWTMLALVNSGSVQVQTIGLAVATHQHAMTKNKYLPDIQLQAGSDGGPGNRLGKLRYNKYIGVGFQWTIFDGFKREETIREAQAKLRECQVEFDRAKDTVISSMQNHFYSLEKAFLSYMTAVEAVKLAEQAMEQAKQQQNAGAITPLDYRDVAKGLTEARHSLNQACYDLLSNYYALQEEAGLDAPSAV
jgi:outer membrane protein TolC